MRILNVALVAAALAAPATAALAEEAQEPIFVCTADQVHPALGFLPVTFSPEVYALLGGDPDDCQTPVEQF